MGCLARDKYGQHFCLAIKFNQPVGAWDVSKVLMKYMFAWDFSIDQSRLVETSFNQPLASWDVSRVRNMAYSKWANSHRITSLLSRDFTNWLSLDLLHVFITTFTHLSYCQNFYRSI